MYIIIERNFKEIFIVPAYKEELSSRFKFTSPDSHIKLLIDTSVDEYREYALKNLNLKKGYYESVYINYDVPFLYAENLEQAAIWKEWVESRILINKLARIG